MTYSKAIAVAVDMLGAAVFWEKPDVTISSLCAMAIAGGHANWRWRALASFLEKVDPGHLDGAIKSDLARSIAIQAALATYQPVSSTFHQPK